MPDNLEGCVFKGVTILKWSDHAGDLLVSPVPSLERAGRNRVIKQQMENRPAKRVIQT